MPSWRLAMTFRRNAIETWPAPAYEEGILVRTAFGRKRVLMQDPGGIAHVLVDNAANYRLARARIRVMRPVVGHGLVASEGAEWRMQRRTMAPNFTPRAVPILTRFMVEAGAEVLAQLEAKADKPINILNAMQLLALEVAGRSMFSVEMSHQGPELRRMIHEYGQGFGRPSFVDFLLPERIPTVRNLGRRRFHARWTKLIDSIIAARTEPTGSENPRDLLDLLRAARDPETGQGFSLPELRDQVATMIIAGHESTGLTLFWSLFLLASAPAVQKRLAEEVKGIDIRTETANELLSRLPYTRAVVSEALRLYPAFPTIGREAIADDNYQGVSIPAGSNVVISTWVLHRHRRLWTNPDVFDPGRFLGEAPPRFTYLPFGVGPRVCIGAHFAMAEMVLILAMMVQRFRITRASSEPVLPVAVISTHPDHEPSFRLERR
jgi:unspecific monooxygenase